MAEIIFDGNYFGERIQRRNGFREQLNEHEVISSFEGKITLENNAEGDPSKYCIKSTEPKNVNIESIINSDFKEYLVGG